jgi:hypothetical protein
LIVWRATMSVFTVVAFPHNPWAKMARIVAVVVGIPAGQSAVTVPKGRISSLIAYLRKIK